MSKKPTITEVTSGYLSGSTINSNFTALRNAFDNTISRDGSTPNTMTADLDLNNKDILNAKEIKATSIAIGGVSLQDSVDAAAASATAAAISESNASDSEDLAQEWAESPVNPGETGTKSAKTWAGEASVSAAASSNSAAASSSSADSANTSLLALGVALSNDLGAFSVDANGDLNVSFNGSISSVEVDSSGDLLMTYTE